jgi:threonine/homoserine/homoserine lactone efflux protein
MEIELLVRGLLLGLAVAAAVGPMAILCIRRTLADGRSAGLATGSGIAGADGCYALIAAFGVTAIADVLIDYRMVMQMAGGAFLIYLGVKIARSEPAVRAADSADASHVSGWFLSAFALTLANPMTIASFAAMFAGLGLASAATWSAGLALVSGVVAGSMFWWIALTFVVSAAGRRLSVKALLWVNRMSGAAIAGFGIVAIVAVIL